MSELSDSTRDPPMPARLEALIAHAPWVRALARSLVADAHLAEDLVQDTYAAALRRPPEAGSNLRGWLATVVRNLARQSHRARARRRRHETEAGRRAGPAGGDLVEKVLAEKGIVEAVLQLDEPYRTAVLMRYYEDLPPRKIAAALGVPVSTVHTRIGRGIERLRQRLDRDHGGRRAWLMALIPSLQPATDTLSALLGAAIMNSKIYVAAAGAAALVLGSVAFWPEADSAVADPGRSAAVIPPRVAGKGTQEPEPAAAAAGERRVLPAPEPPPPDVAPALHPVSGRLVDAEGTPLVGRRVGFFPGQATTVEMQVADRTGALGAFRLSIPKTAGTLRIAEDGWRTVLAPEVRDDQPAGALIVAAPAIDLGGRVVDEFGQGLDAVRLKVELPDSFRTRFDEVSDAAAETFVAHRSGADGRFAITDACYVDGARLTATLPGFAPLSRPLPAGGDEGLELRMHRVQRAEGTISGQVLDRSGQVVAGAWVTLGAAGTRSDERGAFVLKVPQEGPTDVMYAIKKGSLPARLERPGADQGAPGADQGVPGADRRAPGADRGAPGADRGAEGAARGWPAEVVLRLGGSPLAVAGRVVDHAGEPVAGARVWVFDGSCAGRVDRTTATVQGLILGCPTRSDLARMIRESGANPRELLGRTATASWPFVRSGADGAFRIEGLVDRTYVLRAMVDETLLMVEVSGVRAGQEGVELRFAPDCYHRVLRGRVLSKRGRPIAGADIFTMCDPAVVRFGEGASTQHSTAQHKKTDREGRFSFTEVPRNLVYIRVQHEDTVPLEFGRRNEGGLTALVGDRPENLEIRVDARIHVKVTLDDPARADAFAVLDPDGRTLTINQFQGRSRTELERQPLHDGKSGVVVVPEVATRLVLYKDGKPVHESAIDLVPGEVNELHR